MVKVLNSRELRSIDLKSIPDAVILAFNTLIVKNWSGKASEFKQSDVIAYVASEGLTEEEVIKNHWLDVEPLYRENGFKVRCTRVTMRVVNSPSGKLNRMLGSSSGPGPMTFYHSTGVRIPYPMH